MDAGDGEVERDLLVGFEIQVGQVERVTIDPVPVLLVARQPLGEDGDALVTEQPLVPLEGLAARRVLGGIPGTWCAMASSVSGCAASSRTRTRSVTRSSRSSFGGASIGGEPTAAGVP